MTRSLFLISATSFLMVTPAVADGNVAAGVKVADRCVSCHSLYYRTSKKGPTLRGIVGRPVASVSGFEYSDAMKAFGATGATWDEATLDQFLKDPLLYVKGTKMMLVSPVRKDSERADLIEFLKSNN